MIADYVNMQLWMLTYKKMCNMQKQISEACLIGSSITEIKKRNSKNARNAMNLNYRNLETVK